MNKEIGLFELTQEKIELSRPKKVHCCYQTANRIHIFDENKMKSTK